MTRERSLEHVLLFEDVLVLLAAMALARLIDGRLAAVVPGLKPPVAYSEYAYLVLVFLPTWIFAAERLGIHRVQALTGERSEIVRRVILTQAWGAAAIGLILTSAQVSLNRSLIAVFLTLSTLLLWAAKVFQTRWLRRHRGQSRVLLIGDVSSDLTSEFARLRGRKIEHWSGDDPDALKTHFRSASFDEVVLLGQFPPAKVLGFVEACAEAGLPVFVPIDDQTVPLPPPQVETVGKSHFIVYQPRKIAAQALAMKALGDRILAFVLIVLALPLMLAIAVLVRLFVGRRVLYVQQRGGLYGKPFTMLKFRTMRLGAERERAELSGLNEMDGPVFKMKNDPG